jgi:hypothetical protein
MMRLTFAMTAALLLASSACAQPASAERSFLPADGRITFTIEPSGRDGMVQFQLTRREGNNHWTHGRTIEASALQGYAAADGPIRFRLARDAGTIDCDGVMRSGRAIGECSFTVDAAFSALLAERGMGAPTRDQAFSMAMSDIGRAYLDELARQRYEATTSAELARAGDHSVRLDYLVAMGGHGYRVGRLAALIRMRDHGVTPDYIAELARLGVRDVPADDIVRLRDHGVRAEFVGELRGLGYQDLPIEQLIRLRDHGVTTDFVRELAGQGVRGLPPEELIRMRDHGVSAELVGALRGLSVAGLDTDDIVRIRDHGVSTAYVSGLRDLGYAGISAEELVRLRSHGVRTDFIRRANGDGARRSPDELVALRNGGFASN